MKIPREVRRQPHRKHSAIAMAGCFLIACVAIVYFVAVVSPPSGGAFDAFVPPDYAGGSTLAKGTYPPVPPIEKRPHPPPKISPDDPIFAIADLHGDCDALVDLLVNASLVPPNSKADSKPVWVGGRATLIQLGDAWDRGAHAPLIFHWLSNLAPQAAAAGGAVIRLLGNHDVLNLKGVSAFVIPAEVHAYFDGSAPSRILDLHQGPIGQSIKWEHHGAFASPAHGAIFIHGSLTRSMLNRWATRTRAPADGVVGLSARGRDAATAASAEDTEDAAVAAHDAAPAALTPVDTPAVNADGSINASLFDSRAARARSRAAVAARAYPDDPTDAQRWPANADPGATMAALSPAAYRAFQVSDTIMRAVQLGRLDDPVLLDTGPLWDRTLTDASPTGGCLIAKDMLIALNDPLPARETALYGEAVAAAAAAAATTAPKVKTIIVGHTPQQVARIACEGEVVLLDGMMSYAYGQKKRTMLRVDPGGQLTIIEIVVESIRKWEV